MDISELLRAYLENLLAGNRRACRQIIRTARNSGLSAEVLYRDLVWEAMQAVEKLWREDRINAATEHLATRINRMIADQLQAELAEVPATGKKAIVTCAPHEPEELAGQVISDMLEAKGWEVFFVGGGVPDDEILMLVGLHRPDLLIIYGTRPEGVPAVKALIETIRQIDPYPEMNIMVMGGVFGRAEDLWREVNADIFARDLPEALHLAMTAGPRIPEAKPAPRKRRKRTARAQVPAGAVI